MCNCLCTCLKRFCVKVSYTVLLGVLFAAGLVFAFDVYSTSAHLRIKHFKDAVEVPNALGNTELSFKTGLFGLTLNTYYANTASGCISRQPYPLLNVMATYAIDGDAIKMALKGTKQEVDVVCAAKDIFDDETTNTTYWIGFWCSWGGVALAALCIIAIWLCCVDWCRCCCCKKRSDETVALLRL